MTSSPFYLQQVANCAQAAAATPLANQRNKFLQAMAAWQALADRETAVREVRERREAEKAAAANTSDETGIASSN